MPLGYHGALCYPKPQFRKRRNSLRGLTLKWIDAENENWLLQNFSENRRPQCRTTSISSRRFLPDRGISTLVRCPALPQATPHTSWLSLRYYLARAPSCESGLRWFGLNRHDLQTTGRRRHPAFRSRGRHSNRRSIHCPRYAQNNSTGSVAAHSSRRAWFSATLPPQKCLDSATGRRLQACATAYPVPPRLVFQ